MNPKKIFIILTFSILGYIGLYFCQIIFFQPKKVHYHAGFQVYIDGKLQDFSDGKYMYTKPCREDDDSPASAEEIQIEKAHLHDRVGNVVHVEADGALWNDLFTNIRFPIDKSEIATAYINGESTKTILSSPIKSYDSVIISVGKEVDKETLLKNAVTKNQILDAEKDSEDC